MLKLPPQSTPLHCHGTWYPMQPPFASKARHNQRQHYNGSKPCTITFLPQPTPDYKPCYHIPPHFAFKPTATNTITTIVCIIFTSYIYIYSRVLRSNPPQPGLPLSWVPYTASFRVQTPTSVNATPYHGIYFLSYPASFCVQNPP